MYICIFVYLYILYIYIFVCCMFSLSLGTLAALLCIWVGGGGSIGPTGHLLDRPGVYWTYCLSYWICLVRPAHVIVYNFV